jgi:DNA-directed RNA polymerase specialized sigma24 family protein
MPPINAGKPERFPSTHWSLVAEAAQEDAGGKRQALGRLLIRYLPALRTHLVYGKRLAPDHADDLLQEFLADKILERDLLGRANQQLGKFRTFLLTALDRFVLNRIRDAGAKKRAPAAGAQLAGGDWAEHLPSPQGPADSFDVAWARGVLSQALDQMRVECEQSGRRDLWDVFQCRVVGPTLEGTEPLDYRQLTRRFGFRSPSEASNILVTAKRMYARALRGVVGQYARDDQEIDIEITELRGILAGSRR